MRRHLVTLLAGLPLALSACGGRLTPPSPAAATCALEPRAAGLRADTVVIGLSRAPNPATAPVPVDHDERLVFGTLYETLVRVDCEGQAHPALAAFWRQTDGGREWTFRLRTGARFWDGAPVTAADVRAAWLRREAALHAVPWAAGPELSLRAADDSTLVVRLARPLQAPDLFADPVFAVAKPVRGLAWPLGTGPWWPEAGPGLLLAPVRGGSRALLRFVTGPADARDLIDGGVDLLVTDDPAALRYAASHPELQAVPLPWDRVYVLLSPAGLTVSDSARAALARYAVRVDASAAATLPWWEAGSRCTTALPPAAATGTLPLRRIVFPSGDPVARDLAGRLVGLGRAGAGAVAAGLPSDEFDTALRAGSATAFVLPLPSRTLDPCGAAAGLFARAPWLALGDGFRDPVTPLIATRRHALIRGTARWMVGWDAIPAPVERP